MMKFKQAIIVRKDLKWGKGKLASHAAHAAVSGVLKSDKNIVDVWEKEGAKKVVLKVKDLNELKELQKKAKKEKLLNIMISDAGKTQLEKGEITALAIGPDEERKIDKVTKKLKLL